MFAGARVMAERIKHIEWNGEYGVKRWSRVTLMLEYLHRSALWADALASDEWPFFDVVGKLGASHLIPSDSVLHEAGVPLDYRGVGGEAGGLLTAAMNFAIVKDRAYKMPAGLPHPYEPIVIFFERGGDFSQDGTGFIDVDMVGVRRETREYHARRTPLVSMDASFLDELDREKRWIK